MSLFEKSNVSVRIGKTDCYDIQASERGESPELIRSEHADHVVVHQPATKKKKKDIRVSLAQMTRRRALANSVETFAGMLRGKTVSFGSRNPQLTKLKRSHKQAAFAP